MAALGAELTLTESAGGGRGWALTHKTVEAARRITEETGGFRTDQLRNADQLSAYHRMGDEIRTETGGKLDAFVQSTGTAASVRGIAEALRARKPGTQTAVY